MRCWHCSNDFAIADFDKEVRCPRCDTPLGYQKPPSVPPMAAPGSAPAQAQVAQLESAPARLRSKSWSNQPTPHNMRCWHCGKSFEVTSFDKEVRCPGCDSNLGYQTPKGTEPVAVRADRLPPATRAQPLPPPLPIEESQPAGPSQLLSEHSRGLIASSLVRNGLVVAGVSSTVVGLAMLGICWGQWQNVLLQIGLSMTILSPPVLVLGLSITYSVWRVRVTTHGLEWTDRKGEHSCTWDAVTAVYRREVRLGLKRGERMTRLRIEIAGQKAVSLNHRLSKYNQLCETVQRMTMERLLSRKRAELAASAADFGPIILREDGIRINLKDIPWERFSYYYVANAHFVAYRTDAKHMQRDAHIVKLEHIPNYLIFLTMLEEMGKRQISAQESDRIWAARRN